MTTAPELRELRVFLTLADELHLGHAAQRLTLTPSRVSQVISKLERSLGGRLFERTSRSVRLTPFGEQARDQRTRRGRALPAAVPRHRPGLDR